MKSPGAISRCVLLGIGLAGTGALLSAPRLDGAGPGDPPKGTIYTTANAGAQLAGGGVVASLITIDPATANWAPVFDDCQIRPRVSPDGKSVAFLRGNTVWVRRLAGDEEAKRVLDLDGPSSGSPPVWSPDGKQIVISAGAVAPGGPWVFKTVRVNADGSGRAELKLPTEDTVHDWSADGQWLLTPSSRNAKIGWQLYVQHPDGTGVRQVTEGGNPFYARFSPDGRRLLYTDGAAENRRGIWVVGVDGKDRRRVVATGKDDQVSACWSPDGTRIAVATRKTEGGQSSAQVDVMDLDGGNRVTIPLPDGSDPDMPDWR